MVDARRSVHRAVRADARLDDRRAWRCRRSSASSDASPSGLQWVMNGYLLVIAALVVTGGRLGDIFGRRAVFTDRPGDLRGRLGAVGGAVERGGADRPAGSCRGSARRRCCRSRWRSSATPSPERSRPRALGVWAAISALALAIGPLVGGLLVDVDWRLIFWINVPVLAVGVADDARRRSPETRDETRHPQARPRRPGAARRRTHRARSCRWSSRATGGSGSARTPRRVGGGRGR